MDVRILNYEDTEALLSPADCVSAIEQVYAEEAKGLTVNRPRSHSFLKQDGGTDMEQIYYCFKTMEGGVKAMGYFALRVSSGPHPYRVVDGAWRHEFMPAILTARGEKRFLELLMLFEIHSGALLAVMPGGYIQKMRVGSTTALGSKHMARADSRVFGLIGSGWQASAQLLAHNEYFRMQRVKVYSTSPAKRERFSFEMSETLGLPVEPVNSAEEAVRGSDVVLSATGSHVPTFKGEWLEPGSHWAFITPEEGGTDAFDRSDRVVVNSHTVSRNVWAPADGDGPAGKETFAIEVLQYPVLADLVAGRIRGRESDQEITCFVTTQGLGIQFVALTSRAYEKAVERKIGRLENWDHLLQTVNW